MKQTMMPPPSSGPASVGARNETSVLFRVDQINGTSNAKTPSSGAAPETAIVDGSNDEGVIDLKSLTSPSRRPVGLPVAPLFSEPPPMTVEVDGRNAASPPHGRPRLIHGIAAAAAIVGIGLLISFAFRGEDPVQRIAAAPPPSPPPVIVASTSVDPPPTTTTSSGNDEGPAKAAPPKPQHNGMKARAVKTSVNSVKAAPVVKAADPCGCKGNFNCILACTAKGGK